jgi:hypothetical protein
MDHFVILGKTLESYLISKPRKSAQTLILLRSTKIFVHWSNLMVECILILNSTLLYKNEEKHKIIYI